MTYFPVELLITALSNLRKRLGPGGLPLRTMFTCGPEEEGYLVPFKWVD